MVKKCKKSERKKNWNKRIKYGRKSGVIIVVSIEVEKTDILTIRNCITEIVFSHQRERDGNREVEPNETQNRRIDEKKMLCGISNIS